MNEKGPTIVGAQFICPWPISLATEPGPYSYEATPKRGFRCCLVQTWTDLKPNMHVVSQMKGNILSEGKLQTKISDKNLFSN